MDVLKVRWNLKRSLRKGVSIWVANLQFPHAFVYPLTRLLLSSQIYKSGKVF